MKSFLVKISLVLFVYIWLLYQPISAQKDTIRVFPYSCSFEDEENPSQYWDIISPISSPNKWIIGKGTASRGEKSIYISPDNGNTVGYNNVSGGAVTYINIEVEKNQKYNISFDWKATDVVGDKLYLAIIGDDEAEIVVSESEVIPNYIKNATAIYEIPPSLGWNTYTFDFAPTGTSFYRLVFYWLNDQTNSRPPGGCIDNFQIAKNTSCEKPQNLTIKYINGATSLNWLGGADSYELEYKEFYEKNWTIVSNIKGNTHSIQGLKEGVYTFYLRSKCGGTYSNWIVYHNFLIANADADCLNYADLYSNDVEVTYGPFDNPHDSIGVIDFGYASELSRHAVHYIPGETDPRTGDRLKTVPDGEIASVRIGRWGKGGRSEAITYDYHVVEGAEILLLKYAVVLEQPGHEEKDQPQFSLEIQDEDGFLLDDNECNIVHFFAENDSSWETEPAHSEYGTAVEVVWKDWTTFGINLKDYIGRKVRISLIARGCGFSAHGGYAYFTLDCTPGTLTGLTCADNSVDSIGAPDGFSYVWHKKYVNPQDTITTNQYFYPMLGDTTTYVCKVISILNPDCYMNFEAVLRPHFPRAVASYGVKYRNCQAEVTFKDHSYVYTIDNNTGKEIVTARKIDSFLWDFGNGVTSTLQNPPPAVYNASGKYEVTLHVNLSGLCDSIWTDTIVVPELKEQHNYLAESICAGGFYTMNGKRYYDAGIHLDTLLTRSGCDSILHLDLKVNEVKKSILDRTICYGESYDFDGELISKAGSYKKNYETIYGCDSIITLNLSILPEIKFTLSSLPEIEGNDGEIIISNAPVNYTYTLDGQENVSLTGLAAKEYEVTIFVEQDGVICSKSQKIEVMASCLDIEIATSSPVCIESQQVAVPYTLHLGTFDKYNVSFDALGLSAGLKNQENLVPTAEELFIPFPSDVLPGHYVASISFPGQICDTTIQVPFSIYYSGGVLAQRWNDVLGVLNQDYNGGGYDFIGFQWYRNGIKLDGETKSYLYVPEGLSSSDHYSVELTRNPDNITVFTCDFIPAEQNGELMLVKNTVQSQEKYKIISPEEGIVRVYTTTGVLLEEGNLSQGVNEYPSPVATGYYLLHVKTLEREKTYYLRVVQ